MSGTEYLFACPNGEILIYRDITRTELLSDTKPIDIHEFHSEQNYIDYAKITRIRNAGKDNGKWIKIRTSFKKTGFETTKDQDTTQHREAL